MERDNLENSLFLMEENDQNIDPIWEKILAYRFCPGRIIWTKQSGKEIVLCHPGQIVERKKILEYLEKDMSLSYISLANWEIVDKLEEVWIRFEEESKNKIHAFEDLVTSREEILKILKPVFWNGDGEESLLSLVCAFEKIFFGVSFDIEKDWIDESHLFFERGALMGTVFTIYGLCLGYMDFQFLKKLYLSGFLLDRLTESKEHSSLYFDELDRNRKEGTGTLQDTDLSYGNDNIQMIFKGPFWKNLIKRNHEKLDGTGKVGLWEGEMGDLEIGLLTLNSFVEYKHFEYSKLDGSLILKSIFMGNTSERIQFLLTNVFNKVEDENNNYEEVAGL